MLTLAVDGDDLMAYVDKAHKIDRAYTNRLKDKEVGLFILDTKSNWHWHWKLACIEGVYTPKTMQVRAVDQ